MIKHVGTSGGKSPLIQLGPAFYEQPHKAQVDYLHKLASAMNHAADLIQKERDQLFVEKNVLLEQLDQAQAAADISKQNMINAITGNNTATQELSERVVELRTKVAQQAKAIKDLTKGD